MHPAVKRQLRSWQTRFPIVLDAKFWFQNRYRSYTRRPFEPEFSLLRHLKVGQDQQIVDIGANRGQSINAIRIFQPRARIVAFEANPLLAERLQRALAYDTQTSIRAQGLGDKAGTMTLHVPFYRNWMFDGLASVNRESAQSWLNAERIAGFDPKLQRIEEVSCAIECLDAIDLNPIFIKIDVQGFEEHVLNGGAQTLQRCQPILLIEIDTTVPAILDQLGYREYALEGDTLHPITKDQDRKSNSLFLTPAWVERLGARGLDLHH